MLERGGPADIRSAILASGVWHPLDVSERRPVEELLTCQF